ncbi:radial spoke head protein 3 homolog B isoform X1 [Pieris rapae]|uniref:radial spoke head protein 3 homolog B isoform X1 n=2 Tax=Pieris rapae TaxID=64459 RepID=UPI001E27BD64|nr:radial spoke head protein 3 homolog B isoform X1 [Pieris rapae]
MPPGDSQGDESSFTVIESVTRDEQSVIARNVNVVRPLARDVPPEARTMLDERFSQTLNMKLKRLKPREARVPLEKPRFVTTVRCGEFLPPPPPLASLLRLPPAPLYSYSSRPHPLAIRHKRSATPQYGSVVTGATGATSAQYSNVMHDKRVVRGSTFAAHPHAAGDGQESAAARAARTRRRALARRAALARLRPGTPPPAPGRRHLPVQTERYLEELFDKGLEVEAGVQTDLFVDRPATPRYVPAITGAHAATQIYPGDLFDFDLEVQGIVGVLVGKTVQQALGEVAQEEELETLREQQRRYRELRDAELAERQRLAATDVRLQHEKERRVAEARAAAISAQEARQRVAAATLVQGYVAELLPSVLAGLRDAGYLVRRLHRGVEEEFMPWLIEEVSKEIESIITSRDVITEIVREVTEARADLYAAAGEREAQYETPLDSLTPPEPSAEEEDAIIEDQ